jgi:hypothetical protein
MNNQPRRFLVIAATIIAAIAIAVGIYASSYLGTVTTTSQIGRSEHRLNPQLALLPASLGHSS